MGKSIRQAKSKHMAPRDGSQKGPLRSEAARTRKVE
jgi:hypothetical protein